MSNMPSKELNDAIAAARAGRRDDAARMLRDIVDDEPNNADALIWLAGVTPDLDEQRELLERALEIAPGNRRAQQGMAWLRDNHPELWSSSGGARSITERSTPPYEQTAVPSTAASDAPTEMMPVVDPQRPPQSDAFVVPPEQTDQMPAYTPPGSAPTGGYTDRMAVPPAAPAAIRDSRGNLSRWLLVIVWLFGFGAVATIAALTILSPLLTATNIKATVDPVLRPYELQIADGEIQRNMLWYTIGLIALAVADFMIILGLMFRARWAWIVNLLVALLVVAGTVGLMTLAATTVPSVPRSLIGTIVAWLPLVGLGLFALIYLILSVTSRRPFFRPKLHPRSQPVQAYGR